MARTAALRTRRAILALPAVAALTVGLGAATAQAETRTAVTRSGAACLWAGVTHPQGTPIVAGGRAFTCGTDNLGGPHWFRGAATTQLSTVPNPGAYTDPTGLFSGGARQPGTSYTDYCTGNQLIPGTDDIYQAVPNRDGRIYWKAVAPISEWSFDAVSPRPEPTWRRGSLCRDGNLT
ncbi:hypothetical protein [Nocardia sp. NPDC051570]|uniref:hypothetical protein n=1 Tax=Nocardia sp. NPDC051570 TaxID=3364324 RepID=UPI0037993C90